MSDRNQLVKDNFIRFVKTGNFPEPLSQTSISDSGLSNEQILDLFESQLISRHLDLHSRVMQKQKDDHKKYLGNKSFFYENVSHFTTLLEAN